MTGAIRVAIHSGRIPSVRALSSTPVEQPVLYGNATEITGGGRVVEDELLPTVAVRRDTSAITKTLSSSICKVLSVQLKREVIGTKDRIDLAWNVDLREG